MTLHVGFPYRISWRGLTETVGLQQHIRGMLESLLLTDSGERVNRPDYGGSLSHLLFGPANSEIAATVQSVLRGEVLHWLGDLIELRELQVQSEENALQVTISYVIRDSAQVDTAQFMLTA